MNGMKVWTDQLSEFGNDMPLDQDPTAFAHRLVAEHERGAHQTDPHAVCPLCRGARRRTAPRCRLSRVQNAVAVVVEAMERGLRDGWMTDPLWDAKENLEESAGLRATANHVDSEIEILRRERLLELQHAFNLLAVICESEQPLAHDRFWEAMMTLRSELMGGPEPMH